jgi:hypothetical protein
MTIRATSAVLLLVTLSLAQGKTPDKTKQLKPLTPQELAGDAMARGSTDFTALEKFEIRTLQMKVNAAKLAIRDAQDAVDTARARVLEAQDALSEATNALATKVQESLKKRGLTLADATACDGPGPGACADVAVDDIVLVKNPKPAPEKK